MFLITILSEFKFGLTIKNYEQFVIQSSFITFFITCLLFLNDEISITNRGVYEIINLVKRYNFIFYRYKMTCFDHFSPRLVKVHHYIFICNRISLTFYLHKSAQLSTLEIIKLFNCKFNNFRIMYRNFKLYFDCI